MIYHNTYDSICVIYHKIQVPIIHQNSRNRKISLSKLLADQKAILTRCITYDYYLICNMSNVIICN